MRLFVVVAAIAALAGCGSKKSAWAEVAAFAAATEDVIPKLGQVVGLIARLPTVDRTQQPSRFGDYRYEHVLIYASDLNAIDHVSAPVFDDTTLNSDDRTYDTNRVVDCYHAVYGKPKATAESVSMECSDLDRAHYLVVIEPGPRTYGSGYLIGQDGMLLVFELTTGIYRGARAYHATTSAAQPELAPALSGAIGDALAPASDPR